MTSYAQTDAGTRTAEGWAMFAGIIMVIVGASNVIFGLTALFNDDVLTKVGGQLLVADFTTWGWVSLLIGIVMILAAFGLFTGKSWALWATIVFATVNAIGQISWITVYPIWSLIAIALNVIVIYQLTTRWNPAP
jgi:hypothetical protein